MTKKKSRTNLQENLIISPYVGESYRSLDDQGRISLPSMYLSTLSKPNYFVGEWKDPNIFIFPSYLIEEWVNTSSQNYHEEKRIEFLIKFGLLPMDNQKRIKLFGGNKIDSDEIIPRLSSNILEQRIRSLKEEEKYYMQIMGNSMGLIINLNKTTIKEKRK